MTIHIGSSAKRVQSDIRMTLRAAMSVERRQLKKATVSTRERRVIVEGSGIRIWLYGDGWIHFSTDIDAPLSTEKLAIANRYNNAIASYYNNLFIGKARVHVTTTLSEEVSPKAVNLAKFCSKEALGKISEVFGCDMVPRGVWLTSRERGPKPSIVITGFQKRYDVDFIFPSVETDHIPKDALMETHKKLQATIRKFLPILRAD
jgi:hypothetical protein